MLQTLRNAWKVEEIRKKILFTLLIVLLYRLGNAIPVPYVNVGLLQNYFDTVQNTVLGLLDVMSGGAFSTATIFALSIQPYINASIIIQLLTIAIPSLGRMAQEGGEEGKKKIQSITRYATVAIAIIQGVGYFFLMKNYGILTSTSVWAALVIIVSFIAGSSFVMWMGEQITEFGIGNGISIILFAGILSRVPTMVSSLIAYGSQAAINWLWVTLLVVGLTAAVRLRPLLEQNGSVETAQLPGELSRCIHPAALCAAAARSFALYRSRKESRLHAEAMRTALTEQYSAVAEALGVLSEQLGRLSLIHISEPTRP